MVEENGLHYLARLDQAVQKMLVEEVRRAFLGTKDQEESRQERVHTHDRTAEDNNHQIVVVVAEEDSHSDGMETGLELVGDVLAAGDLVEKSSADKIQS